MLVCGRALTCRKRTLLIVNYWLSIQIIISSIQWKRALEANIMPVTRKGKLQEWSGLKNSQQYFTRQGYLFSFEGGTLLLRETGTMWRNKNAIHRASFWCMIHVPMSIIILVLKNKVGCPRGVMVKSVGLRNRSTRVRTPVELLRLLPKYPWERYEPPYPPSYGLNSTTTVLLREWI